MVKTGHCHCQAQLICLALSQQSPIIQNGRGTREGWVPYKCLLLLLGQPALEGGKAGGSGSQRSVGGGEGKPGMVPSEHPALRGNRYVPLAHRTFICHLSATCSVRMGRAQQDKRRHYSEWSLSALRMNGVLKAQHYGLDYFSSLHN